MIRHMRDDSVRQVDVNALGPAVLLRLLGVPFDRMPGWLGLGFASYRRRTNAHKRFRLLGGLIGYERIGDRKEFRFLWAPFGRIPRGVREAFEAGLK